MHSVCHGETNGSLEPCKEPVVEVQSIGTECGITLINGLCEKHKEHNDDHSAER